MNLYQKKEKNLEYIPAVINKIIIGADVFPASIIDATTPLNLIPLNNAITKLAIAPMPAASVAVKKPPQIPRTKNIKPIIEKPEYISVLLILWLNQLCQVLVQVLDLNFPYQIICYI
ncbi:MAG: hypothetical protein CM15mP81_19500 [Alphaproteobacteria bacterium]|nr:MAG: hypothetical protein CM15mP81_19500 [Alphaproteobacteria bacterium]